MKVAGCPLCDEAGGRVVLQAPRWRLVHAPEAGLPAFYRLVWQEHVKEFSQLAAAVGTRSLLLFGPTDPAIWAPQNPQVRILRSSDLTMKGIELGDVVAALEKLPCAPMCG